MGWTDSLLLEGKKYTLKNAAVTVFYRDPESKKGFWFLSGIIMPTDEEDVPQGFICLKRITNKNEEVVELINIREIIKIKETIKDAAK